MKFSTRLTTSSIILAGLSSTTGFALAHSDTPHPDNPKSTQRGQLGIAGAFCYELVIDKMAKEGVQSAVLVYVMDHAGKKMQTASASATATILAGKSKSSIPLKPDGDNRMKGLASYSATADMKVLASITLAGNPPEQTRLTPLTAAKDGHTDHQH